MEKNLTGSAISSEGLDERRRRLLFRAWHRGTREMDLIMGRFADENLAGLNEPDLREFEGWIDLPDPDLLAWVTGERDVPAGQDTPLFARLRDFHFRTGGAR